MRLTIFGGTGPTGLLLIDQALDAGHEVTAYARTPGKLPARGRLTAVAGELDKVDKVAAAVEGADAVLSLLGPGKHTKDPAPLVDGYRNLVAAMHATNVRRLVAMGTPVVSDPADGKEFKVGLALTMRKVFAPTISTTEVRIGEVIRGSGLDWTIVRVPFLTNGPRTEHIRVRRIGEGGGLRLSRRNAAAFFLAQAADTGRIGHAPLITDT